MAAQLVSIIIATYNAEAWIGETVQSVLQQPGDDWELIVVDDGSTDQTLYRLGQFEHPALKIIKQENAGCAAARNAGAKQARGQYLAFLDHDDFWFPWSLKTYRELLTIESPPSVLLGSPLHFRKIEQCIDKKEQPMLKRCFDDFYHAGLNRMWTGATASVIDADLYRAIDGFHDICLEDLDFYLRAGDAPVFIKIDSPPTVAHRQHANNFSDKPHYWEQGLATLKKRHAQGIYPKHDQYTNRACETLSLHGSEIAKHRLAVSSIYSSWRIYRECFALHLDAKNWAALYKWPIQAALCSIGRGWRRN